MNRFGFIFGAVALLCGVQGCTTDVDDDDGERGVQEQEARTSRSCGGRGGRTCGDDQFCNYAPGLLCGAADHLGTCKKKPDVCTEQLKPVCGCDQKTYRNACAANAAGVSVLESRPCSEPAEADLLEGQSCGGMAGGSCGEGFFCHYEPREQCGTRDQSGTCRRKPQFCPEVYSPVCGCDDKTYSNECKANGSGVAVLHGGACTN